jgi:tRNA threonylcarbamoyladenosine modification (KEOPS) complex Cgi121 subunit
VARELRIETRCFAVEEGSADELKERLCLRHPRLVVQTVRTGAASNELFAEMVAAQTLRAAATSNLLAKRREIDLLLRLAGTTQISVAIAKIGARKGEPFVLVVAGERSQMAGLREERGWTRLPRAELSKDEMERVESAALLNAARD